MKKYKNILFVCTGNTCRSVMAEGFFKKIGSASTYKVMSAGINAFEGISPTREAIVVMQEYHIDISNHKSKQLNNELLSAADHIFVMTNQHLNYIMKMNPLQKGKTYLLKEFASTHKNVIPEKSCKNEIIDPIGKGIDCYRSVGKELYINLLQILDKLDRD